MNFFVDLAVGGVPGGEHEAEAGDVHHTLGPGHRQAPARNCHRGQQPLQHTSVARIRDA
jgi:hypothetical protein